jgi:hypothetical protein
MRLRTITAILLVTLSLTACAWPSAPRATWSGPSTGPGSRQPMPSGYSNASVWTAKLTWSRSGLIQTGIPATPVQGSFYVPPAGFGLVAVAGDVVVTATFTTPDAHNPNAVTLQFRNAKTGDVIASKGLATYEFGGIRADTAGGKPIVEVRYSPVALSTDGSVVISTVFDTSAHQLWTSAGHVVSGLGAPGLLDVSGSSLVSHGFLLRQNPGTNFWNRGASYDVLDLTDKIVMTIPYYWHYNDSIPAQSAQNVVQLVGGYAVVTHGDYDYQAPAPPSPTQARFRFTIYDLGQGGKKVADVPESVPWVRNNVNIAPHAVGSCRGKLVMMWATGSMLGPSDVNVSVLDLRTGQTTHPVAVAKLLRSIPPMFSALSDAECSTMLLYGDLPTPTAFAISLAHGTLLWHLDHHDQYLSIHGGAIYALQKYPSPGRLESMAAADGSTLSSDLAVVPLTFTADGSPIFAQLADPTTCEPRPPSPSATGAAVRSAYPPASCAVTLWVGRGSG